MTRTRWLGSLPTDFLAPGPLPLPCLPFASSSKAKTEISKPRRNTSETINAWIRMPAEGVPNPSKNWVPLLPGSGTRFYWHALQSFLYYFASFAFGSLFINPFLNLAGAIWQQNGLATNPRPTDWLFKASVEASVGTLTISRLSLALI